VRSHVKASFAAPIQGADSRRVHIGLACLTMLGLAAFLGIGAPSAFAVDTCPNAVFRTGPSAKLPDCRAYELVTPRYTGGIPPTFNIGAIDELPSPGETELVSPSGNDVVFNTEGGSLTGSSGIGDLDRYRTRRTASGWETELVSPRGDQGPAGSTRPSASSPDHNYFFQELSKEPLLHTPNGFEPLARGSLGDDLSEQAVGKLITENATHVFFVSKAHLEPQAAPAGIFSLYDRTPGGPTKVISLLPGNQQTSEEARWLGATKDGSEVAFELGGPSNFGQIEWGHSPIYVRRSESTQEAVRPYGVAVGKKLHCTSGPGGATLEYQWLHDGTPIGGANGANYTVAPGDEGTVVQCQVTASNAEGASVNTSQTRLVEPYQEKEYPSGFAGVTPSGSSFAVGTQLTCSTVASGGSTSSFQWMKDGAAIGGATSSTYTTVEADAGHSVQCRKAMSDSNGTFVDYSSSISIYKAVPRASANPTIANVTDPGHAPAIGDELSCASGTWSNSPSFAYRWLRNGNEIGGATFSTYAVVAEDEGKALQCRVTATNAAGSTQAVSVKAFFTSSGPSGEAHPFLEAFGSAAKPEFGEAKSLAVDQSSGDLLVINGADFTISRWHPDGTPADFSALGTNVIDGEGPEADSAPGGLNFGAGPREMQIAVDNSGTATDGDIYVTQIGKRLIDVFSSSGAYLGQLTEFKEGSAANGPLTGLGEVCGVAVDSTGAVYVGDYSHGIHKFVPSANPPANADNTANFSYPEACTLAAGAGPTAGFIFADNYEGEMAKLNSATGTQEYLVTSGVKTVSVDPASGHVYAVKATELAEFNASGPSASAVSSTELSGKGVAIRASTGNVYSSNESSSNVVVYGPAVPSTPEPPQQFSAGGVSGSAQVGNSLSCTAGVWSDHPTFAYHWLRNGEEIAGATSTNYTLTAEDREDVIQCRVTAMNASGSVVAIDASSGARYVAKTAPTASASMPTPSLAYAGIFNGHLFYTDRYTEPFDGKPSQPADLFSYDLDSGKSTPITDTGDAAFVNVSEDGSHVYFARRFEEGAETSGKLYVWNRATDSTTPIAEISGEDFSSFRPGEAGLTNWARAVGPYKNSSTGRAVNHTRSTSNGRVLVFEATTQLSGFDNTEATPETCTKSEEHAGEHELCEEVYRYDAESEELTCVSCGPGTGPATGEAQLLRFGNGLYELEPVSALGLVNNLSEDGDTVFFESTEALVPRDVNQQRDVYRWKAGEGIALISTGQDGQESAIYGASRDGRNVVFATHEQLLPEDENGTIVRLYDARVDGGFPPPESTVTEPCDGDACQGQASAAPDPPNVASSSLNGGGNVSAKPKCGKGRHRIVGGGKERCVKRKHRKHRRAGAKREASR
jgi:hypothetical protein